MRIWPGIIIPTKNNTAKIRISSLYKKREYSFAWVGVMVCCVHNWWIPMTSVPHIKKTPPQVTAFMAMSRPDMKVPIAIISVTRGKIDTR